MTEAQFIRAAKVALSRDRVTYNQFVAEMYAGGYTGDSGLLLSVWNDVFGRAR